MQDIFRHIYLVWRNLYFCIERRDNYQEKVKNNGVISLTNMATALVLHQFPLRLTYE